MSKDEKILFYDKQGAYSSLLKNSLEKSAERVFFSKKIGDIYRYIDNCSARPSLIFIFVDERELIELLEVQTLDVDIVYAPTNLNVYNKIKRSKILESINLFQNKGGVVLDLLVLIDALEGRTKKA